MDLQSLWFWLWLPVWLGAASACTLYAVSPSRFVWTVKWLGSRHITTTASRIYSDRARPLMNRAIYGTPVPSLPLMHIEADAEIPYPTVTITKSTGRPPWEEAVPVLAMGSRMAARLTPKTSLAYRFGTELMRSLRPLEVLLIHKPL